MASPKLRSILSSPASIGNSTKKSILAAACRARRRFVIESVFSSCCVPTLLCAGVTSTSSACGRRSRSTRKTCAKKATIQVLLCDFFTLCRLNSSMRMGRDSDTEDVLTVEQQAEVTHALVLSGVFVVQLPCSSTHNRKQRLGTAHSCTV
jgi:hypothetical protein